MIRRTSETDPIRIDSVELPGGGRIGMTFCPGKKDSNALFGHWDRDLDTDLAAVRDWGAGLLVTLVETQEFDLLGVPHLGARTRALGLDWLHLPIRDVSVPSPEFEAAWPTHGAEMVGRLRRGGSIVLHCRGGLGRTGLVAARLLVELGHHPREAVAEVRNARPGTIETDSQESYVHRCTASGFVQA